MLSAVCRHCSTPEGLQLCLSVPLKGSFWIDLFFSAPVQKLLSCLWHSIYDGATVSLGSGTTEQYV